MRGGNEMLSVVTQQRPLPPGEWADVDLTLGPRRCAVTLNGREAGEIGIPWHEGGYRVYLGARGAASRVDHIALTVPMTPGVAIGGGMPGPSRGNGPTTLTAGLAANPRAIP